MSYISSLVDKVNATFSYDFLINSKLINLFSENDLMNLYKKNPANYYSFDKENFTKLASKIPNKSPMISLERNSDKCVHIQYRSYDLYDDIPIAKYIRNDFNNNDEFTRWAQMLLNRSDYNFNTTINENDNILTLSTCYKNNEKVVLHAKLIKKEEK